MSSPEGTRGPAPDDDDFAASIAALWDGARERMLARVGVVEDAVAALVMASLAEPGRAEAEREAHKLAGALGTFGMPAGSDLARSLEEALRAGPRMERAPVLAEQVERLRRIVESGPAGDEAPGPTGAASAAPTGPAVVLDGVGAALAGPLAAELERRGMQVVPAAARPGAPVALAAGPAGDLADRVAALAAGGARVAALVDDDDVERVGLVQRGARRLLPVSLGAAAIAAELAALTVEDAAQRGRVVALDDDPDLLAVVRAVLGADGHQVEALTDPAELWTTLDRVRPDLVVLDLELPGTSGTELCRALRADPTRRELAVLFLTAATTPEVILQVFEAGADDFVPKPVVPHVLRARVANRLERAGLLRAARETDPVSGLAVRAAGHARLEALRGVAERLGQPLAIGVVRLAGLADVEESEGFAAADRALRDVAARLRAASGPDDPALRWDDTDLVVASLGLDAGALASALTPVVGGLPPALRATAGVAELPADGRSVEAVRRAAAGAAAGIAPADGPPVATAAGGGATEPEALDVLVVEDDEVLAALVLHALGTRGVSTRHATDGDQAAGLLSGARPLVRPRVVLLDWDLPGRDGPAVLRELRDAPALRGAEVIMLTARATEQEQLAVLRLGADDVVTKPVSVPVLLRKVDRALERRRRPEPAG